MDYKNNGNTPPPYGNQGYNNQGYNNNGYNNQGYNNNGYNNQGYNNNGYNNQGYNNQGYGNRNYGGYPQFDANEYYGRNDAFASDAEGKSRGVAALLAIFLGGLGIHYFYLGKPVAGAVTFLLSLVSCSVWYWVMLAQGIMMFTISNADFDRKYVYNPSSFPLF